MNEPIIQPELKITIDEESKDVLVVDAPSWPGTPYVGRGEGIYEALGNWLLNNQTKLGIKIDVLPEAVKYEMARREKELSER